MKIDAGFLLIFVIIAVVLLIAWLRKSARQEVEPNINSAQKIHNATQNQPKGNSSQECTPPTQANASNDPLLGIVDAKIVQFVINFCQTHLQKYGLESIVLFGSRATGVKKLGKGTFGDHDFLAVVSNSAPDEILTGRAEFYKLYNRLVSELNDCHLGSVDLLVARAERFAEAGPDAPFIYAARTQGIEVYSVSE